MTTKKMCGFPSRIMKNEWLDGIFPQESLKQQPINRILRKTKSGKHDVFIIDPEDTEVCHFRPDLCEIVDEEVREHP